VVGDYAGGSVWVHLAVGDGTFAVGRRYRMGDGQVERGLVADFDGDGAVDIAAPEDGANDEADFSGVLVRRGLGDGTFGEPEEVVSHYDFPFDFPTVGGAVADFNGDGLPDLTFSEGTDLVGYDYDPPPSDRVFVFLNWSGQSAPPCVVPDVVDLTVRWARRELRMKGCTLGQVRRRYARKVRKGAIVSQRPAPNAVRASDAPVNVVVSRGTP
jgi:hypothetical protein